MNQDRQLGEGAARRVGSPRIAIARLSAVGDCVQTMPLASALRDLAPDAHIAWIVEKAAAPLVETVPAPGVVHLKFARA